MSDRQVSSDLDRVLTHWMRRMAGGDFEGACGD